MSKLSILLIFCILFTSVGGAIGQSTDRFDLVVTNARIIDGAGNPWFRGSIAVKDGKIAKVGRFEIPAGTNTIDAKNQIVAPGFIDVHAHTEDIYGNPKAENFIRMGVTSLVTGNCGGSDLDIAAFLGKTKTTPLAVNIASLIGHNTVRSKVVGLDNREPTLDEQLRMEQYVEQAMKDGAVGFSTGLIYLPGTYAKTDEVVSMA